MGGIYGSSTLASMQGGRGSGGGGGSGIGGEGIRQSGPRTVRLVEPWKVEDIVIPTTGGATTSTAATTSAATTSTAVEEGEKWHDEDDDEEGQEQEDREGEKGEQEREERERYERAGSIGMSVSPSKRPVVSDAERKVSPTPSPHSPFLTLSSYSHLPSPLSPLTHPLTHEHSHRSPPSPLPPLLLAPPPTPPYHPPTQTLTNTHTGNPRTAALSPNSFRHLLRGAGTWVEEDVAFSCWFAAQGVSVSG